MRAQLIPLDGSATIDIVKDLTLVGRREDCDLRLQHKSISKMHCVIVKTDGLLFLRDLGSTNGTRVNGQRVRRAALLPNDELAIAGHKFRVFLGPANALEGLESRTQQMDAREVADLEQRTNPPPSPKKPSPSPAPPIQPNPLPDRYPEGVIDS
ncbi:MAG TPA: FHA domain-containing protein [Gemmataceae bacterium]|nr:FHA domain-containing protein [Gemmataceae bacterium]